MRPTNPTHVHHTQPTNTTFPKQEYQQNTTSRLIIRGLEGFRNPPCSGNRKAAPLWEAALKSGAKEAVSNWEACSWESTGRAALYRHPSSGATPLPFFSSSSYNQEQVRRSRFHAEGFAPGELLRIDVASPLVYTSTHLRICVLTHVLIYARTCLPGHVGGHLPKHSPTCLRHYLATCVLAGVPTWVSNWVIAAVHTYLGEWSSAQLLASVRVCLPACPRT